MLHKLSSATGCSIFIFCTYMSFWNPPSKILKLCRIVFSSSSSHVQIRAWHGCHVLSLCKVSVVQVAKKTRRAKNRGMTRVIFGSKDNTRVYCATVTYILGRDSGHFINNKTFVRIECIGTQNKKDIGTKKSINLMTLNFFFGLLCYLVECSQSIICRYF